MERKSMGDFIAVLRKTKGLTQKELGDKLNISDKSISRWERNETMPDISLIPVLADLLDVTADELLRGERICAEKENEDPEKTQKRVEWVLNKSFSRYRALSMISLALTLIGCIAAMAANFIFHKATLGFYCFLIGFIPSVLCQTGLYMYYKSGTEVDGMYTTSIEAHRSRMTGHFRKLAYYFIIIFAFCLPLYIFGSINYTDYLIMQGFAQASDFAEGAAETAAKVQIGLQADTWFILGSVFGGVSAGICFIFDYIRDYIQTKNTRRIKYFIVLLLMIGATIIAAFRLKNVLPMKLSEGSEFQTYESFKEHMETRPEGMTNAVYKLRQDSDYWIRKVKDSDGKQLFAYTLINDDVVKIIYSDTPTRLPITTYTQEQLNAGQKKADSLSSVWIIIILLECLAVYIVYKRKRMKKVTLEKGISHGETSEENCFRKRN